MLTLGQKIREKRIDKGMTQADLGDGLVTPSMISQIESDKANPSYKVLERIADKLETPVDYFLSDIETQILESTRHRLAKAYMGSKDYNTAINILLGIEHTFSNRVNYSEVRLEIGECYFRLHRYDEAIKELTLVFERARQEGDFCVAVKSLHMMGQVEMERKRYHNAIFHLRKAFEMFDSMNDDLINQASVAIDLGNAYNVVGDAEEALRVLQTANFLVEGLDNKDLLAQTYIMLSNACLLTNQLELANDYANVANSIFVAQANVKLSIDVRKNLVMTQASTTGDYSTAIADLTQFVALYKSNNFLLDAAVALGDTAECYFQQEEYEQCIAVCDRALSELPDLEKQAAPILFTKGRALGRQGHHIQAIETLQASRIIFSNFGMLLDVAKVYASLAEVYEAQGALENSIDCLQKMRSSLEGTLRDRGIVL